MALDGFSEHCAALLEGSYDCVDRIVLNACFSRGHSPGGFRSWWRDFTGSDDNLDETHLMRMAGHFARAVWAWTKRQGIPIVKCEKGERKHESAEQYLPKDPGFTGVFLVQVSKCPALVWQVRRYGEKGLDLRPKTPWPYVNHYSFHIIDPDWGHLTIKMSGHPPFGSQVILNGHEWVYRQLRKRGIQATVEGNCFTASSDTPALGEIAETLSSSGSIGRLSQVCERWIYSSCLCFGLSFEEQERSRFRYQYWSYQIEYCRNLLFETARDMEQIYQSTIDRSRTLFDLKTVCTIFGSKYRPHRKRLRRERFKVTIEKPSFDLTLFKIHFGKLILKIYDKGERLLRIEVVVNNTKALGLGRGIDKLPGSITMLRGILTRFLDVVRSISVDFLDNAALDQLPLPTCTGNTRLAGINILNKRMRAVTRAILSQSPSPFGFTSSQLATKVREITGQSEQEYSTRQASYDLKKLRGKGLVEKLKKSRAYRPVLDRIRPLFAWEILNHNVITPLISSLKRNPGGRPPKNWGPIDYHFLNLRNELRRTFATLALT